MKTPNGAVSCCTSLALHWLVSRIFVDIGRRSEVVLGQLFRFFAEWDSKIHTRSLSDLGLAFPTIASVPPDR